MKPSEEDIANFISFAPDANEGVAFIFLEVSMLRHLHLATLSFTDMV
jgi:hypothetical protein